MRNILLLLVCLWVGACSYLPEHEGSKYGSKLDNNIQHVVLLWLKAPSDEAVKTIITNTYALENIPQVQSLHVGAAIKSLRPVVDSSYHVGITLSFKSQEDLKSYVSHPIHQHYVNTFIKGKLAKMVVYDF